MKKKPMTTAEMFAELAEGQRLLAEQIAKLTKRKKSRITPEMRARWDESQRLLAEQIAKLDKKIAERDAKRAAAGES
jgi:DNA-binding transcriptional regulator PaaX